MKKVLLALLLASCSKVPAGYVGVIVNLYGNDKGVSERVVPVGRYWVGINENLFLFPTFMQNYVWTKSPHEGSPNDESITFQTSQGLSINGDFGITYTIYPDKVVNVFQKYRRGLEEITDTFLRNIVRDALNKNVSSMSVEDVYGSGKQKLMDAVTKHIQAEVDPIGIKVEKVYIVGDFRLPATVIEAINSKINATQKALQIENELAQSAAEAKKTLVKAQAEADANRKIAQSLTPEYLKYIAIQKWDAKLPHVMSGTMPFIEIKQ